MYIMGGGEFRVRCFSFSLLRVCTYQSAATTTNGWLHTHQKKRETNSDFRNLVGHHHRVLRRNLLASRLAAIKVTVVLLRIAVRRTKHVVALARKAEQTDLLATSKATLFVLLNLAGWRLLVAVVRSISARTTISSSSSSISRGRHRLSNNVAARITFVGVRSGCGSGGCR